MALRVTIGRLGLFCCGAALVLLSACARDRSPAPAAADWWEPVSASATGPADAAAPTAFTTAVEFGLAADGRIEPCSPYSPSFRRFGYRLRVVGADATEVTFLNDAPEGPFGSVIQPPGTRGFSHEGQVIVIWVPLQARSGQFAVTVRLPDGRSASAAIDHRALPASAGGFCQNATRPSV